MELPLEHVTVTDTADANCTPEEVQYLTGFFDGSGHINHHSKGARLEVVASIEHPEALVLFRRAFGGGVYHHSAGRGMSKPAIRWMLFRKSEVCRAASILQEASLAKRAELGLLFAQPAHPQGAEAGTSEDGLSPTQSTSTWAYFAGFFDSGGCIHVRSRGGGLCVSVSRKTPETLMALQHMMRSDVSWTLEEPSRANPYYTLHLRGAEGSRTVLQRLLSAGLLVKRKAANLALTATPDNFHVIRDEMSKLLGNQSRYRRLSEQGVARAVKVTNLGRKVNRLREKAESSKWLEALQDLNDLKQHHAEHSAAEALDLLRTDIRGLLRRGASRQTS